MYVIFDDTGNVYGLCDRADGIQVEGKEMHYLAIPEGYSWSQCTLTQVDGEWTLVTGA